MTIFIPGNTAVENTRTLAQSALPNAPVVTDEPRTRVEIRARAGALLRTAAQRQQRLADRIDPIRDASCNWHAPAT
ncbi:hypothetical protein E0H73_01605 [Kribbella pittospori]|uniref:Uncharacterized protein n=1 Tax=Kribbella pittospori TaxID=722689 RepID=A0A4R0KYA8_9ACTN|nr:hypothetical protein [Kribbella pittospori]TCC65660.1 hypothetical protein E0H73_01605 [Kribbella pittospori]